jgi:hypothetical protein
MTLSDRLLFHKRDHRLLEVDRDPLELVVQQRHRLRQPGRRDRELVSGERPAAVGADTPRRRAIPIPTRGGAVPGSGWVARGVPSARAGGSRTRSGTRPLTSPALPRR